MTLRRRLAATIGALGLVAAACGDDDTGLVEGDAGDGPDLPDLSGETVEVAAVWTGAEQQGFEEVLGAFEDETGADVAYTSTGDDIATVLGTRIEGGDPPDVAMLPQPGLLEQLAQRGALQPVNGEVAELVEENYAPVWRELGTVDSELYGVWFKAANKSTVWFDTADFEQAGVEPPSDWDEFLETARTIADSGVTPVSIGASDGWVLTDWFENVYLDLAGPETYDRLAAHEIPWTHESVTEALSTLAELWAEDRLLVGNPLQTSFPESVTQVFAEDADGAIVYEGDFVAGVIADETAATVGEEARFFDFPAVGGAEPSVVGGGDVAVAMADTDEAQALLRFLATPEAATIWAERGGFTSPNEAVDLDAYPDEVSREIAESLIEAETFRFDMSDQAPAEFGSTPGGGEWRILQGFIANPSNVQDTARALEQAAAAAYGR